MNSEDMTDRELLELAAKATGIEGSFVEPHEVNESLWWGIELDSEERFNPLTDDGNALRLAVRLGLDITFFPDCKEPWVQVARGSYGADELYGTDQDRATRRAIVRCAAEIGRNKT